MEAGLAWIRSLNQTDTVTKPWRTILASFFVGAACGPAVHMPAATAEQAAAEQAPPERLNVWRIQSPSGQTSYLLGTYHIGVSIEEALPAPHATLIDEARVVLLELDTENIDHEIVRAATMLPPEEDLERILGPELWPKLVQRFSSVPEAVLHRLTPWTVTAMIMGEDAAAKRSVQSDGAEQAEGSRPALPMLDIQVRERARERGVEVRALETLAEQFDMLNSIPTESVLEYLRPALLTPELARADSVARREQVVTGNTDPIEAELMAEFARAPAIYDAMLFARNERWMTPLLEEFERGNAFVAVGLGHAFGERGLVSLLEARGYRTERLLRQPVASVD